MPRLTARAKPLAKLRAAKLAAQNAQKKEEEEMRQPTTRAPARVPNSPSAAPSRAERTDSDRAALLKGSDNLSREEAEELGHFSRRLYVLNSSARPGVKSTDVLFHVTSSATQEKNVVVVPRTFIPIDLALSESRSDVLASREFLGLVDRGVLHIIGDDVAAELLSEEDAILEKRRLNEGRSAALATPAEELSASAEVKSLCANREPWSRKAPALRTLLPSLSKDDKDYLLSQIPESETRLRAMLQR